MLDLKRLSKNELLIQNIGIGYDIIGDWLVDEEGIIYFRNKIKNRLHPFSLNIYDLLEKDIYKLADLNGESIL